MKVHVLNIFLILIAAIDRKIWMDWFILKTYLRHFKNMM